MKDGGGRRNPWLWLLRVSLLVLAGGCASRQGNLDEALLHWRPPHLKGASPGELYCLRCPDRIEVAVRGPHPWSVQRTIGIDGRIRLPQAGLVRVGGLTPRELSDELTRELGIPPRQISVQVLDHRSQKLFIHGELQGVQRVVSYHGPETVLQVLQRAGGITSGAAVRDIQVVRGNVADGRAPEVFEVDLEEIILKKNLETNIVLEPFDQIYIGQSRRSIVGKCMPPWLRPLYDSLWGLARPGRKGKPAPVSP